MNTNARIRVIIHCRGAGADLFRTLVSLACQSVGAKRLNVALTSTSPSDHESREALLLHSALGFNDLSVLDARGLHPAQALNAATLGGGENAIAIVPEGTRLSPVFLADCLSALALDHVQAAYTAHTAGSPDGLPLVRMRPFRADQLTRTNPVGPATLVRRDAWERLGGMRHGLALYQWDFWLRMAMTGGGIARVPKLLACCRPLLRLTPWQDGHAKSMLVVSSPGAFEPEVCRWALAFLRGEDWALPCQPGVIPGRREVQDMHAGFPTTPGDARYGWTFGSPMRTA